MTPPDGGVPGLAGSQQGLRFELSPIAGVPTPPTASVPADAGEPGPGGLAPSDAGGSSPPPGAAGELPTPSADPAPGPTTRPGGSSSGGSGGSGGGAARPADGADRPLKLLPSLDDLAVDPSGWARLALAPGTFGALLLDLPGYVPSTVVLPAGSGVGELTLRPAIGSPAPMGTATIEGSLGPASAGLLVRYAGPALAELRRVIVDEAGAFTLEVPVRGTEAGVLIVSGRSVDAPLALEWTQVTAGETTTVTVATLKEPTGVWSAPEPPGDLVAAPAGLVLLAGEPDAPVRLDVLGYPLSAVPTYDLPGFRLAAAFTAQAVDGTAGSRVLVSGPESASFLAAPGLAAIPDRLVPGEMIHWSDVGAPLYTVRLFQTGATFPIWEGATTGARIPLPRTLPAGLADLELEVMAWAATDVTIYSVANLRQLRIPAETAAPGGRVSWRMRRGLSTAPAR